MEPRLPCRIPLFIPFGIHTLLKRSPILLNGLLHVSNPGQCEAKAYGGGENKPAEE